MKTNTIVVIALCVIAFSGCIGTSDVDEIDVTEDVSTKVKTGSVEDGFTDTLTATVVMFKEDPEFLMKVTLYEGGIGTSSPAADGDSEDITWIKLDMQGEFMTYLVTDSRGGEAHLLVSDNGKARLEIGGFDPMHGTWE